MKIPLLPTWFQKKKPEAPDAAPPTIEAELERLTAARAELEQQESFVVAARERLQAERSEASSAGLKAAKERLEELRELVPIVEADVEAARARRAADERAAKEREVERLREETADVEPRYLELNLSELEVWKTILKIRLARHENRSTHDRLVEQRCELERQLEGRPKDIPVWNSWDRGTHPDQWISKDVYKLFVDAVPYSHADRDSLEQYVRGRIANFLSAKQDG